MQYLKENVRERIITSALDEFAENGYNNSSMRTIAKRANVTVGNIYRYFTNKEDLLDVCLEPILDTIDSIISRDFALEQKMNGQFDNMLIHKIIASNISKIYINHSKEFLVLRSGLQGTYYSKYYESLLLSVTEKIKSLSRLIIEDYENINPMVFNIIARNQIESIIYILDNAGLDDAQDVIEQYLSISMKVFD